MAGTFHSVQLRYDRKLPVIENKFLVPYEHLDICGFLELVKAESAQYIGCVLLDILSPVFHLQPGVIDDAAGDIHFIERLSDNPALPDRDQNLVAPQKPWRKGRIVARPDRISRDYEILPADPGFQFRPVLQIGFLVPETGITD